MANIDSILQRLQKVRKQGKGYIACCPAHDDRTPSLSLYEHSDGRILLHCFAGCGGADVLAAIGLSLSDLYPEPLWKNLPIPTGFPGGTKRVEEVKQAKQRDSLAYQERVVISSCRNRRRNGEKLNQADLLRERQAFERLKALGIDWREVA